MTHKWVIDDPERMQIPTLSDVQQLAQLLRAEQEYRCQIGDTKETAEANRIFAQYDEKLSYLRACMTDNASGSIDDVRAKVRMILDDIESSDFESRDFNNAIKDILESIYSDCSMVERSQSRRAA